MNSEHQWIANNGNNDKPCKYCSRYPILKLRYRCILCVSKSCRFCLADRDQLPPENSTFSETRPNRQQTLELRILTLENILEHLTNKMVQLEKMIEHINSIIQKLE